MRCDVRPAESRTRTQTDWLDSAHSFSFGAHYDPSNTHFGLLLAHNEDVLTPDTGFDDHPHRELDIVTWMIAGELLHSDTASPAVTRLAPGQLQVLSAGTGVTHAERAGPAGAHYLQMWLAPDQSGLSPTYRCTEVDLRVGELTQVLSLGRARLWAARLVGDSELSLPDAPFLHLFVVRGAVTVAGNELTAGDAARISDASALALTARGDTEILLWQMLGTLG